MFKDFPRIDASNIKSTYEEIPEKNIPWKFPRKIFHGWLGASTHCCCPESWESIIQHFASPEKNKFTISSIVSIKCISLSHHDKAEISLSQTILNWGPFALPHLIW